MPTTSVPLFNTDPNIQAQAALLQQRQAMAQELLKQGMTPLDTNNRTVGGVGYRISPFEGMAKALQTYMGQKGVQDTTQQQAGLASQAYAALLNKYQPGADASYSDDQRQGAETAAMPGPGTDGMGPPDPQKMAAALMGQQPAQGGQNPNNPNGIPAQLIAGYTAGMIPKEVFEAQAARYKPTDATVQALQGGMDPMQANRTKFAFDTTDPKVRAMQQAGFSPQQIYAAQYAESAKAGDIERRPGQSFQNSFTGQAGITPTIPPNANPVGVPAPNGAIPGVTPIPGAQPVVQGNAQSQSTGTSDGSIRDVTTNAGAVIPMRGGDAVRAAQPGVRGSFRGNPAEIAMQIAEIKDPQQRANAQAALEEQIKREGNPVQLGQSTAAKAGATASQEELSRAWSAQQGAHQNAQTNIALLQNMKGLTDKAITGYEPDRRTYLAKLGAYVGIGSMDEKASASDLTNKYSAQLIAGLAQKGGMSTDAARDLVMAGTPNSHMQPGAIKEAIDGLVAREQMTQARTAALQKHATARDPVAFQQAATAFDQAADPRLFQLRNMAPAQAQSYVNQLKTTNPAAYQQLMQKAAALKQMGAF